MIENIILAVILVGIIGGVLFYLYRAKKRGAACIGCPHCKKCAGKGNCGGDQDHSGN